MKLKACPFCDGELKWCGDNPEELHVCHQVYCDDCGLQFELNKIPDEMPTVDKMRELMAKVLNTRTPNHKERT